MRINLYQHILIARFALFREFLRHCPEPTPMKWLMVQVSCENLDPFDALSRLFRLAQDEVLVFGSSEDERDYEIQVGSSVASMQLCMKLMKTKGDSRFCQEGHIYFCVDEAQTVLGNVQALDMIDDMYEAVLGLYATTKAEHSEQIVASSGSTQVGDMDSAMSCEVTLEPSYSVIDPILVFSGTALDIDKLKESMESALNRLFTDPKTGKLTIPDNPPPQKWKEYYVHNTFPLVTDDQSFWQLYRHHITQIISELQATQDSSVNSPVLRPLLSRSGRPLSLEHIQLDGKSLGEYLKSNTWLSRPLETSPVEKIIDLVCWINSLRRSVTDVSSVRESPHGLEAVLDQQDPALVTAEMEHVTRLLCDTRLNEPREIRLALLDMLTDYGGLSPDSFAELVRAPPKTRFEECDLPELAAELLEQLRNIYIRQVITANSKVLRGRYRWSTMYIEGIIMRATRPERGLPKLATIREIVEHASQNVKTVATKSLQRQIRRMVDQGKSGLVEDLYRAGIRAEIMGRPTIFLKSGYAELVTYGFALVENYGREDVKFKIAEPLAVHAIMHHLRGDGREEYRQLMQQWLIHTQDDHEVQAMFGKAAEWYIAAVSSEEHFLADPVHAADHDMPGF